MFAHGPFTVTVFSANFGIIVSDDQKHVMLVMLWHFDDCLLQLFIPVFLVLFDRFIGWGVTQNDGKLAVFGVEACFDHPITDRFPFQRSVGLLLGDYKGNTADMCIAMSRVAQTPVHRHSLTTRISSLYLFISCMTCANLRSHSWCEHSMPLCRPWFWARALSHPCLPSVGFKQTWSYSQMSGSNPPWCPLW